MTHSLTSFVNNTSIHYIPATAEHSYLLHQFTLGETPFRKKYLFSTLFNLHLE